MKNVFITISEGSIARNILRSFVLEEILKNKDVLVYLLVYDEKAGGYRKEFESERVKIISFPPLQQGFFDRVLMFFARNSLRTETIFADQLTHLHFSKNYPMFFIKRSLGILFGRSVSFHGLVRLIASFRGSTRQMQNVFREFKPDLLFSTDVLDELDMDAMREARKRNVKVISMVRSWDNLTNHYLAEIIPDLLLVWSPFVFGKAIKVHHIPENKIKIVGIPHYDWYAHKEVLKSREEFLRPYNIDPQKKLILFAGIGKDLAPHETEVAEILDKAISGGEVKGDVSVIFRPHPSFLVDRDHIKTLSHTIFDDAVANYTAKDKSSWEMDKDKISHLVNSLYHADLVITTASTITMDAVSFDKPVICIGFDGKSKEPYWNSVARYYKDYTHYKDITATHGFKLANNKEELIGFVNDYLLNPTTDAEGRKKIRDEFIWRLDGKSAERVSKVILDNI